MNDMIRRQDALSFLRNWERVKDYSWGERNIIKATINEIESLPSAQTEPLSDAYTKAVWTWLLDYQIKVAKLKGRYTPYEVLSWVANDWRKEHE